MSRIFLSPPDVGERERALLLEAFNSNWIAPVGPHLERFEKAMCEWTGSGHAVALSSGTAALHLALQVLGVQRGDEVITSTLTFVATANAIRYCGAHPVFVDSDEDTWNMNPELLAQALRTRPRRPAAIVTVDLYGQCADYDALKVVADEHDVPIVEDAAEALGASYRGRPAGSFGQLAAFSFNGNKILTTSGGGMLVSNDSSLIERARYLSTQARSPAPHYEHEAVGYNYRLSNLLAALGIAQLEGLAAKTERRRAIRTFYERKLGTVPGVSLMPLAPYGDANCWLTCVTIDPSVAGVDSATIREALQRSDIEARPVWKPMHLQPVYRNSPVIGGTIAERLFRTGLCLPSGSSMSDDDLERVANAFLSAIR